MGSRSAISAGVLAVTLAAIPLTAPPTSAAAAAADCPNGGGLLGGVTDGLCDVVDVVTGTVDTLTGDTVKPVTKGLNDTTDEVLGTVGKVGPTGTPSSENAPEPSHGATLLPETLGKVCLPVLACGDRDSGDEAAPKPTPKVSDPAPEATGSADKRAREDEREDATAPTTAPTMGPTPPQSEPYLMDTSEDPVADEPTVDTDDARIDLLWPNPFARELSVPMRERVVRPSGPASDVVGTGLTIALLASAIAATRIVQQRRQRSERSDSIPFEPVRAAGGRHRLA
ncbi:hypothetical protein [Nonomuraea sp. NPDC048916]|uniref:hypothetical protein n=1 Tax=Nonomuraea sp. NPDC048916 TaxID=3154232 RepID=UPI0033FAB04E